MSTGTGAPSTITSSMYQPAWLTAVDAMKSEKKTVAMVFVLGAACGVLAYTGEASQAATAASSAATSSGIPGASWAQTAATMNITPISAKHTSGPDLLM